MTFRWFRRAKEVPDELLEHVKKGVLAALGALQQQLLEQRKMIEQVHEEAVDAKRVHRDVARLDTIATGTRALLDDHVSRLDQAIAHLRGQQTGGMRGRGRNRQAEDLGGALLELLGPERAEQLVVELAQRGGANGSSSLPDSPIGG